MGAPSVDGKVESPHLKAGRSTHPLNWLAAAAITAAVLTLGSLLDGPSDIEVMQLVAEDAQVRVVLP